MGKHASDTRKYGFFRKIYYYTFDFLKNICMNEIFVLILYCYSIE